MSRLILIIFTALLLLANPLQAQQSPPQDDAGMVTFSTDLICNKSGEALVDSIAEKYAELPFLTGRIRLKSKTLDEFFVANMYMLANPTTLTFTIFAQIDGDDTVCILAGGNKFAPWAKQ
jgi:hypothetical protein